MKLTGIYLACEQNHAVHAVIQGAFHREGEHHEVDGPEENKEGVHANVEEKGRSWVCDLVHLRDH